MTEPVYKIIQVVGTSTKGYDDAVRNGIHQAGKTIEGIKWFEVVEFRGAFAGKDLVFQATLKIGFKLRD